MTIKVGINGFGRIGRQVYRAIREHHPDRIEVGRPCDIGATKR
jgi:glyceraldehyde-3-phosphate dehydrogenase/erythrose-4-phosphate dehydrogenase